MPAQHILKISQITRSEYDTTGQEAGFLAELLNNNIPVVPGFCISHAAFNYYLDQHHLRSQINQLIKQLKSNDTKQTQDISHQISQLIKSNPLPTGLEQHIQTLLKEITQTNITVQTISDLPDHHYYQQTILTESAAQSIDRWVRQTWQAYFSPQLLIRRLKLGHLNTGPGTSILVQPTVEAKSSGIAYLHPSKKNLLTIEAILGPRYRELSQQLTPDYYEIKTTNTNLEYSAINTQLHQYTPNSDKLEPVSGHLQNQPKLDNQQLTELAKLIINAQQIIEVPLQFDWAFDDQFHICMVRPQTHTRQNLRLFNDYQLHHIDQQHPLASGQVLSPGATVGRAQKINQAEDWESTSRGDILILNQVELTDIESLRLAGGLILTQPGQTSVGAIVARELGIPAIAVDTHATAIIRNHQVISLDAHHGNIYTGKHPLKPITVKLPSYVSNVEAIETHTQLMINSSESGLASYLASKGVDGLAVVKGELIAADVLGQHPRKLLQSGRRSLYSNNLTEHLQGLAAPFGERPVLFQLSDWHHAALKHLEGSKQLEPHENNPALGYRGTDRLLQEPDLLALDLESFKTVRQAYTNLHIVIPRIQTVDQYKAVKKLMYHYGVKRTPNLHFYLEITAPSSIIQLPELIKSGLDGLVIPVDQLASHLLTTDLSNYRHGHRIEEAKQLTLDVCQQIISQTKKAKLPVILTGSWLNTDPEYVQKLIKLRVNGISVSPQMYDQVKVNIYRNETNLAKNKHRQTKRKK